MKEISHKSNALQKLKESYSLVLVPRPVEQRVLHRALEAIAKPPPRWRQPVLAVSLAALGIGIAVVLFFGISVQEHRVEPAEHLSYEARILAVAGQVEVVRGQSRTQAQEQMVLATDELIRTAQQSSVSIQIGMHRAKLHWETSFSVNELARNRIELSLHQGKVEITAAPLSPGSTLELIAGELRVRVVGTVFSVARVEDCSILTVTEGTVATLFQGESSAVAAGEQQRFCLPEDRAPEQTESPSRTGIDPTVEREAELEPAETGSPVLPDDRMTGPAEILPQIPLLESELKEEAPSQIDSQLSPEEELFHQAQQQIARGKRPEAFQLLEQYIAQHPDGLFFEEALFNIVRQSYLLGQKRDVYKYGGMAATKLPSGSGKLDEVKLLYVQSALELGKDAEQAYRVLAEVEQRLHKLSRGYQEQAVYLQTLAALRTGRMDRAVELGNRYLSGFPNGRYRGEVEKILDRPEKKVVPRDQ